MELILKIISILLDNNLDLSKNQNNQNLREKLLELYPDKSDLTILLSEKMAINWEVIARGNSYKEQVFFLLQDLKSQGRIHELIEAIETDKTEKT